MTRELEPKGLLLKEVLNCARIVAAASFSQSEVCVLSSVLAAQESWSDPSTGRGGLQKKKVSFQLQCVLVVF